MAEEIEMKGLFQSKGNRDLSGGSSVQSPVPNRRSTRLLSAPRSNTQSLAPTHGQTEQESLASVNNNGVVQVKVESEDTFSAPVIGESRQQNHQGTSNHHLEQFSQFGSNTIQFYHLLLPMKTESEVIEQQF